MPEIKNQKLYNKIKEEIIKEYPKHGAYRSMMIVKKYKEAGGEYEGNKKQAKLPKWREEEWINVYEYLKNNKIIKCGDKSAIKNSACRPLKRINEKTATTLPELLKIHSKADILKAIELKNKDPQGTIMKWKQLKVIKKNN